MNGIQKTQKILLTLLLVFLLLCLLSSIIFRGNLSTTITENLLENPDTTVLNHIMLGISSNVDGKISLLPGIIVNLKFITLVAFFVITIYSISKKHIRNILKYYFYLIVSGLMIGMHFVGYQNNSSFGILIRKIYISYFLGIVTYPLVTYYLVILLLVIFMVIMLYSDLRKNSDNYMVK